VLAAAVLAFGALLSTQASAQWVEAGPFTSTNTAAPTPGIANSNTIVYGMDAQGDPVYGAANAVLQSPTDPNTYWVATVSGGIWKTTNGGVTWTPTTDHQPTLAIGAITIDTADPTGKTMYAASGYYSGGAVNDTPASTILKSTDGGNTWQAISPTGYGTAESVKNIIAMGNVIVVATCCSEGHNGDSNAGGLFRSTDGGHIFSAVPSFGSGAEVTNLISANVNNENVLIAARGVTDQTQNAILYSADEGASWTTLLSAGTVVQATNSLNPSNLVFSGGPGGNTLNMKVSAGPGGSLFVVVAQTGTTYEPAVVFYTPQFTPGTSPVWYNLGEAAFTTPSGTCVGPNGCILWANKQASTDFAVIADPKQQGVAYIAGDGIFPSEATSEVATLIRVNYDPTTKLATYTAISFPGLSTAPHPDTRSLSFNSQGNLLTTDDGGVYVLNNPNSPNGTWSAFGGAASDGSPIRAIEAYQAVMDPKTGRLGVGVQDNGASVSPPNAVIGQIKTGVAWQNTLPGDGFSVAVNYKNTGPSILYATADYGSLARVFANQNLSTATPPTLLTIDVAGTAGEGFATYDHTINGPAVAVNAVDPTKLLFRTTRLYTWTDPGAALSGSIDITDITAGAGTVHPVAGSNLFTKTDWTEKLAYGTQDAPDAILAGGALAGGGYGVFLRTQAQASAGTPIDVNNNLLTSYNNAVVNNGADNPIGVLFDPLTEKKFFITDIHNVYATTNTGSTLRTLTLPANFVNPAGLAYIADSYTGQAINGVRALAVGGVTTDGSQGSIIETEAPFAANVNWINLGQGLPNVVVYGLNYYSDVDTMVAALYGRGVYILYDVTSYFADATELWFGKANNDSAPDASRLTGSRALEKFGTGTLTLSGAPTYAGGTIIDAGVVAITADANLGAPQGGVTFNGGTLQFNAPVTSARSLALNAAGTFDAEADTTWSGVISGPGALNKSGPDTLTLTANNSYLGGTFILGGTLAVGFDGALGNPLGQIGIDAGTFAATSSFSTARTVTFGIDGGTIDVGANTLTANGLWIAQGPVTKIGSGVLALEDTSIFQNVTVGAGTLQVDGALGGTSLQIATGGMLSGNGQIAAPTTVFGTLSPGAPGPGVLTFTSPLTLASGSTLRLAIDGTGTGGGPGTYSQIVVDGAALNLGGTLSPFFRDIGGSATNTFTPALGQQFLIASASGGVSGTFAGVDLSNSGLPSDLRMDTIYGSTAVDLVTTPSFYRIAPEGSVWSANQQNVGAALDDLRPAAGTVSTNTTLQNAFNALYLLPPAELGPVLTGLSAEGEARGVANALDTLDAFQTALQDHLIGGPMTAGFNNLSLSVNGAGRDFYSAYNSIASPGAGPTTGVSATASAAPASRPAIEPSHWWSSVFYQNNMTSTSAGIAGGSANITGFIAGLEGEVKPGQLFGIAASFAHTDASGTDSGSGDHYLVTAYGKRTIGPLLAAAYGGVAISSVALHHDFQMGSGIVNQGSNATSLLGGGSLAYTFHYRGLDIAPTATAAFTHMLFDGTRLTSPMGFALNVPRQWVDRFRFTVGPTVTRTVTTDRGMKLTASVSGGFLYQTAPVTALDAQIFTAPALAQSAPAGGAGGYAEVGVYASLTNWLTGFVRWHGEAREHANSNQVSGGLSVTF